MVSVVEGHQIEIEGKGSMTLLKIGEIKFNDVYYVSGFIMNIISIGSLVDQGFVIVFDNEMCLVFVGQNQMVFHGVRKLETNLYQYIMDGPQFLICVVEFSSLATLWHLNNHSIQFLGKQQLGHGVPLLPKNKSICPSYMEGKL